MKVAHGLGFLAPAAAEFPELAPGAVALGMMMVVVMLLSLLLGLRLAHDSPPGLSKSTSR